MFQYIHCVASGAAALDSYLKVGVLGLSMTGALVGFEGEEATGKGIGSSDGGTAFVFERVTANTPPAWGSSSSSIVTATT
jgi:hypothetical protein